MIQLTIRLLERQLRVALAVLMAAAIVSCGGDDANKAEVESPEGAWRATLAPTAMCGQSLTDLGAGSVSNDAVDEVVPVDCTVAAASGNAFDVRAVFAAPGAITIMIGGISSSTDQDMPVSAEVTVSVGEATYMGSAMSCSAWIFGSAQGVDAGQAWFRFLCSEMTSPAGATCGLADGIALVRHCAEQ